jgi:hypothetical protein
MVIGIGSHVKRGEALWPEETGHVVAGPNDRGHWIVAPDNIPSWREPWADPIEVD